MASETKEVDGSGRGEYRLVRFESLSLQWLGHDRMVYNPSSCFNPTTVNATLTLLRVIQLAKVAGVIFRAEKRVDTDL